MGASKKGEKGDAVLNLETDSVHTMDEPQTMSAWKAYWVRYTFTLIIHGTVQLTLSTESVHICWANRVHHASYR
jgi:hypothetical protein